MTLPEYITTITKLHKSGLATEHSYRGALQQLIESIVSNVSVTNEPARVACGAPDYIITKRNIPIGYIEAKDIGKNLDAKEYKEQFSRYKGSLPNLVITDYLEFRLYREGELVSSVKIAELIEGKLHDLPLNFSTFNDFITEFCTHVTQTIRSSSKLAKMMAGKARMLASVIENALNDDEKKDVNTAEESANITLREQLEAFRQVLIHDIDPKGFADIYAQTIAYGMFAARLHDETLEDFSRQEAAELIPKTNPFLRKLFQYIAGYDLDDRIKWIVDALADIFRATDVAGLLKNFGSSTQQNDPIIHFYETFLAEYDPKLRKARGVWYTPEPVVNFIVRAVDDILKTEFGLKDGIADKSKTTIQLDTQNVDNRSKTGLKKQEVEVHRVQILDPATGTGTFLAEVIKQVHSRFKGQEGIWSGYVENDLIPRLNGFELLMASYAMAHLKLELLLTETGYKPTREQRLKVFLTNSLEEHHRDTGTLFANWLSSEANEANRVKRDTPVMVIIGNPPYSGESANKGEWIMNLMEDYKKEPGGKEKLNERNPKWINDDYVKFLRFGQYFIEKNGTGVLAFINPHGFLDNPTFRGMRWHLLKTYDKIYTIDLHGNTKKKEIAPDGSPDLNVFDIEQGVSINIFIKTGEKSANVLGNCFHFDLYGKRELKYEFLIKNSLSKVPFIEIPNKFPMYYMVQKDFEKESEYEKGFSVSNLFTLNSIGIVTARDKLTIGDSKDIVVKTISDFSKLDIEEARKVYSLGKDARDWQISLAQNDLLDSNLSTEKVVKISYRPFDEKWTYYTGKSKGFHCMPRGAVMKHFILGENLGFVFRRQQPESLDLYVFCSKNIVADGYIRSDNKGGESVAPLYIYPNDDSQQSIEQTTERTPNLNTEIVQQMADKLGLVFTNEKEETAETFAPIDILDYIYAVLHSPTYREKYKEFLKIDFPRVPYPENKETFWQLVALGSQIRELHLLESPKTEEYITQYPVSGSNEVSRKMTTKSIGFEMKNEEAQLGKVWINDEQYFDNVPLEAWEFYIGGYQPAQKWLKDRFGRTLNMDDILHYQKIIVALTETNRIMKEIDLVWEV